MIQLYMPVCPPARRQNLTSAFGKLRLKTLNYDYVLELFVVIVFGDRNCNQHISNISEAFVCS